jgi:hypothetical protein
MPVSIVVISSVLRRPMRSEIGAEQDRAGDVADEVERARHPDRVQRVDGRAARLERDAALDERHVDVEHVVEGEQEPQADDSTNRNGIDQASMRSSRASTA